MGDETNTGKEIRINLLPEHLPLFDKSLEENVIINLSFPGLDLKKRINDIKSGLLDEIVDQGRVDEQGGIDISDHTYLMLDTKWLNKTWARLYIFEDHHVIRIKLTNSSRRILREHYAHTLKQKQVKQKK